MVYHCHTCLFVAEPTPETASDPLKLARACTFCPLCGGVLKDEPPILPVKAGDWILRKSDGARCFVCVVLRDQGELVFLCETDDVPEDCSPNVVVLESDALFETPFVYDL